MDYYQFLEDFDSYNEWNNIQKKFQEDEDKLNMNHDRRQEMLKNIKSLKEPADDRVNSPSHYTSGKREVIDIIESAIKDAPSVVFGLLQGQVLKYMLRVWLKDNPLEDLKKARWYLDRLIEQYDASPEPRGWR